MITGGFDLQALYAALDQRRRQQGLTWAEATRQISNMQRTAPKPRAVASSTITSLKTKRLAEADGVLQMLTVWLDRPASDFVWRSPR